MTVTVFLLVFPGSSPHEWTVLRESPPIARRCHMDWEDVARRCSEYRLEIVDGLVCEVYMREDERFSWVRMMTHHEPRCVPKQQ